MMDSSSQGASAGAFQPAVEETSSKLTWARYGGSRSSVFLDRLCSNGGIRRRSEAQRQLNASSAAARLPAEPTAGRPSAP